VYPDKDSWRATVVPTSPGSFESRIKFPREFCGVDTVSLTAMTGLALTFVHHKGFTAGASNLPDMLEFIYLTFDQEFE
jgi:uncharacterized UPF0160 family protein